VLVKWVIHTVNLSVCLCVCLCVVYTTVIETLYTVPAASHSLDRAQNLPRAGADAEWSRIKMEDAGQFSYILGGSICRCTLLI